jgi:hypothetical protein
VRGAQRRAGHFDQEDFRRHGWKSEGPHHPLAIELRAGQLHQRLKHHAVVAGENPPDRNAVGAAAAPADRECTGGEWLRKGELHPG